MTLLIILFLVSALFIWCIIAKMCILAEEWRFHKSFEDTGYPVIEFEVNGGKYLFLLDSGADISIVDSSAEFLIGEVPLGYAKGLSSIQNSDPYMRDLYELELKHGNKSYIEDFIAVDLVQSFEDVYRETGVRLSGIIGTSFFRKYKCILDFKSLKTYVKR